ncbi:hypothetical protein [Rhizomonospora bruguierae]|uniref:hypothetical protein n=1 Tax=Rhizomonospora bruguierae TaxID=1581705 RepID=UPI001BCB92B3|nr:hypothetical protein [Micromonospora sp. NBRC 107566]
MSGQGITGLVTPYNTSEFAAMVEAARSHHYAVMDQYVTIAADLRRLLARIPGDRLGNVDSKMAARRVARQISRAGTYEAYAARAGIRAFHLYQQLFTNKGQQARAKTFDPNK